MGDKFGSPGHRFTEDRLAMQIKQSSNPQQEKDSRSIDSSRRRKGLTLFDDGLSEWRRTHKATITPVNNEPAV